MKALLIDLDDTLFSELSYVHSGYREVADSIAALNGLDSEDVLNRMHYEFSKYGRIGVFDRTKEYFEVSVPDTKYLVNLYRSHEPAIKLYWKVDEAIEILCEKFKLVIVTDGNKHVQRKKVEALGLNSVVNIVYCMDYDAPKPSLIPYFEAMDLVGADKEDVIIIGDDPYYDMKVAADLGVDSYRILQGKHMKIRSLDNAKPREHFGSFFMLSHFLLGQN